MSRKPDILTLMLIGPQGLPDCCPHWDDDGKTPSYCALALGMTAVLSGMAPPRRPARDSASSLADAATIISSTDSGVSDATHPGYPFNATSRCSRGTGGGVGN